MVIVRDVIQYIGKRVTNKLHSHEEILVKVGFLPIQSQDISLINADLSDQQRTFQ